MTPEPRPLLIDGPVRAAWSGASAGDLRPTGTGPDRARPLERWVSAATGSTGDPVGTVHWARQVHGSTVVVVPTHRRRSPAAPGPPLRAVAAGVGDALVTATPSTALAVLTADCAPIALGSPEGVAAAVHAGWKGLVAGVVERAVEAMAALGATEVVGVLGPCIHAGCYEFSEPDLDRVAAVLGDQVRSRTEAGRPALDLPAAVSAALAAAGARRGPGPDACTGCAGGYFSHRARGDLERQAMVVWSTPPPGSR